MGVFDDAVQSEVDRLYPSLRTYLPASLDVTDTLLKLCERHPPAEVLEYVKNWVAFMEKCIALGAHIDGDA